MVSAGLVNYLFHRGRIRKKQISSAACRPVSPLLPVVLLPRPLYLRKDGEIVRSERSAPGVTDPHAMGFLEDFQASVEALPAMLNKNYSLMRELDKSLQGVQLENEQRCQQEIEDIKHGLESGSITFDPAKLKFSDEAIEEQRHCIRIADEKVALATQTYDLVDAHIQQLDQFMRKLEELRQEKEAPMAVAATATATVTANANANANAGVSSADATPKGGRSGERGRGGRKKAKVQPVLPAPAVALELPVDPNEPTYCLCNQVSFGEMVACDNPDCKIEWFHFECVGVKEQPKGKWYCPNCIGFQKKRKGK